jgi:hypothetical protein
MSMKEKENRKIAELGLIYSYPDPPRYPHFLFYYGKDEGLLQLRMSLFDISRGPRHYY